MTKEEINKIAVNQMVSKIEEYFKKDGSNFINMEKLNEVMRYSSETKDFIDYLKRQKIFTTKNIPYKRFMDKGYFKMVGNECMASLEGTIYLAKYMRNEELEKGFLKIRESGPLTVKIKKSEFLAEIKKYFSKEQLETINNLIDDLYYDGKFHEDETFIEYCISALIYYFTKRLSIYKKLYENSQNAK